MSYITIDNLNITKLDDILNGGFFQDIEAGINGGTKRLKGCCYTYGKK